MKHSKVNPQHIAQALEFDFNKRSGISSLPELSFDDLMKWEHWPTLLELFGKAGGVIIVVSLSVCPYIHEYINFK